ncbi:MAG: serine hydrolase [Gammaproteobacteria bacterium]|nr:serine hydrolase [Gammaproteobacteria bacterium]
MQIMQTQSLRSAVLALTLLCPLASAETKPMQGVPPTRDSQVTFHNYRDSPYSQWAFRNAGAPMHVVMVPRQGEIVPLAAGDSSRLGAMQAFDRTFADNFADGVIVMQGSRVLHEKYFHGFNRHAQHIWFSMTKSLASSAFGILVEQGKVDLQASPAHYLPELKNSGFARTTIQQVLDHATAIDFKENYTDLESDFFRHYAPALNMAWLPGAADAQPETAEIYGVHDFLVKFVKPDPALEPGAAFDYNSSNADLLGWLIARISGMGFEEFVQQQIWAKLGTEHDAYLVVDRAYMPVVTGGMNATLRDAARFGLMIRDRGRFNGLQVLPANWVDASLKLSPGLIANMAANTKYRHEPWQAYHNMWWLLDAAKGEYCAVGIHGQVIYINRSANTVMAWYSSQPVASSANNPTFHAKLNASRELARRLATQGER